MNDEIKQAFAHPDARAKATASADLVDRISLRDHIVEVEIGAFQVERDTTQRISFNVVVEVRPLTDPVEDDVDRILSYDRVTEAIAYELAAERLNLLETLAARVAERILLEPQALRVFVRIEKLDRGPGALGVEIVRARQAAPATLVEDKPHPRCVYLSNAAIASRNLSGWIDQLEQDVPPLILCVGAPNEAAPQTDATAAQWRIDLLAIEQNAWALAAREARCVVVSTRTEIDWAMKNGQICVWAPSKILLDSVETAPAGQHAVALAVWFATEIEASALWAIGETLPEAVNIPVRSVSLDTVTL